MKREILVTLISFMLFAFVGVGVVLNLFEPIDDFISTSAIFLHSTFSDSIFKSISFLFDSILYVFFSLIILGFLIYQKRKSEVLFAGAVLGAGAVVGYLLKEIFFVERPLGGIVSSFGHSFPSGHMIKATLLIFFIVFLTRDYFMEKKISKIFTIFCWAIIILVGFSRIYLQVHWLSDVLGGFFFAVGWFSLCFSFYNRFNSSNTRGR